MHPSCFSSLQIQLMYFLYDLLCRNNIDPFDDPECEARDIFVNELLCIGTGTCCTFASMMVFILFFSQTHKRIIASIEEESTTHPHKHPFFNLHLHLFITMVFIF
jgi:hypothetical protein